MNEGYIPGTCNMGSQEIKRRKFAGWSGLILTAITITLLWWMEAGSWWRLIVFIPAVMAATGFIQAHSKFCVYFGFGHMFNFAKVGKTDLVVEADYIAKDIAKAWQLLFYALGIGLTITLIVYFLLR